MDVFFPLPFVFAGEFYIIGEGLGLPAIRAEN